MSRLLALISLSIVAGTTHAQLSTAYWAPVAPGKAEVAKIAGGWQLSNHAMIARFDYNGPVFYVANLYTFKSLRMVRARIKTSEAGETNESVQTKTTENGASITFSCNKRGAKVDETYELRNGEHFLRISCALHTPKPLDVSEIDIVTGPNDGDVAQVGTVPGSPVVANSFFAGFAHPMSENVVAQKYFSCLLKRKTPLNGSVTYRGVIGVAPEGQMRRAVAAYVEETRPRPYKPFLHYNSWYDIGYFTPYTEADALSRIQAFGENLAVKRGVKLSSFLFDDGWDDTSTVWQFSKAFPHGFLPLKAAAAKYGAGPGVWLSPWGGYGPPHDARLATGKAAGLEIDDQGYALSGPKYYKLFHDATMNFVKTQGINQFKLDGTGSPDKHTPGSAFDSDFAAAIQLIEDLRAAAKGNLFVNLTTGTWPSPFWLQVADSIWRGGEDDSRAGVGTKRQQWITYRDADTYAGIVKQGPLCPINSLMLHGIIYADHAGDLSKDPGNDFEDEVKAYFTSGTQLQEMYITPGLLTPKNWDDLARWAKWAAANADVLEDVHWIGGDPAKGEVYGHAAWNPRKIIIALRNPTDKPVGYGFNLEKVAELPNSEFLRQFSVEEIGGDTRKLTTGGTALFQIHLEPYEIKLYELTPAEPKKN